MRSPAEYLVAIHTARVYDVAERTPLEFAPLLSQRTGNRVFLKREDRQPVFSFKLRGAYNKMAQLPVAELARGVVAASAGNHAQGVALAARRLGVPATIVVPATTPRIKVEAIQAFGCRLVLHGDTYDEAYAHARALSDAGGQVFVHPYDDPDVIAGQGTIGLEICQQLDEQLDAVFVAVGGGGLIAGIALAVKQLRAGTKIIGVEPEDCDAMSRSLAAGARVTLDRVGLLADGVAVRTVGEEAFRIAREWVDEVVTVGNDEICAAVKHVFEDRRAVLEPSGALAYAGLRRWAERERCSGRTLVAVACGANLNFDRLGYIVERATVGERHEGILAVEIPERPGSFLEFCRTVGPRAITEFNYRMADPDRAVVFAGVQVQDRAEFEALADALRGRGYPTTDLSDNEIAKTHVRHMVGGRSPLARHERLFHFDFPERAGALGRFLEALGGRWNISLFHYRNHGSDRGRVLVGFEVPPETTAEFEAFRTQVGYPSSEETGNPALRLFLG